NTAVTWTAALGTISAAGLYVAPVSATQVMDTVTVTSAADKTKTASATVTVQAQTSNPGIPASFFGMHINRLTSPWPSVPFSSYRSLDSSGVLWADINTGNGTYDWTSLDQWLAKAESGGQDVLYTLFGTPSWASSRGRHSVSPDTSCAYVAEDGPGVCDPPNDLNADGTGTDQHWQDFVTALVNHVGAGKIKYWEIWNEWNISNQWTGTQAQMLRLAQDARTIIRAADPNALLITPSVANADVAAKNWLLPYLQAGGGQYADIIGVHGYVQTANTVCPSSCPLPENVAAVLDNTRAVMATAGQQNKPLFDTEGSWGISSQMTDPDTQVAFTGRFYLIQLGGTAASKGFDKFYWYGWDYTDTGEFYDPNTGMLSPAGVAYQQIYNWSVGATMSSCTPAGTQWTCTFSRAGGYQAEAIWDTSQGCANGFCSTVSVIVPAEYVQYRDLAGNTTAIGGNTVPVGSKPILLENGSAN
ncbi:MAG: cellulase family glycosylhydrolase, partial [Candidatus Sulfotelmatobacter sp.]